MSRKQGPKASDNPRIEAALQYLMHIIDDETKGGRFDAKTTLIMVGHKDRVELMTLGCDCDGCLTRLRNTLDLRISGVQAAIEDVLKPDQIQ